MAELGSNAQTHSIDANEAACQKLPSFHEENGQVQTLAGLGPVPCPLRARPKIHSNHSAIRVQNAAKVQDCVVKKSNEPNMANVLFGYVGNIN